MAAPAHGTVVPVSIARRIRAMIKAGESNLAICAATGVGQPIVSRQRQLLRALVGRDAAADISASSRRGARITNLKRGRDEDEGVDLVDFFAAPRSPRQLRRFIGGDA